MRPFSSNVAGNRSDLRKIRRRPSIERMEGRLLMSATPMDFDGDHKADFYVYNQATATFAYSLASSPTVSRSLQIGIPADTNIEAVADYDGDGKADFAVFDQTKSTYFVHYSTSNNTVTVAIGDPLKSNSIVPVPADYNGDGKTDFAIYDKTGATYYVKPSGNVGAGYAVAIGDPMKVNSIVPVPADYNGDGKADFAIYDKTGATYYVKPSGNILNGYAVAIGDPSKSNSITPVPADYTGDGKADFAIFDATGSTYYVKPSGNILNGFSVAIGDPMKVNSIIPVSADYNGDGLTDFAIYDKTGATYYVKPSGNIFNGYAVAIGDPAKSAAITPTPADYTGDGKADFAIYDDTGAVYYVKPSGNVGSPIVSFIGGTSQNYEPISGAKVDLNGDGVADPLILYDPTTSTFIAPLISSVFPGLPQHSNTLQFGDPSHDNIPIINANADLNGDSKVDSLILYDRTTSTFIAPALPSGVAGHPPRSYTLQLGDPTHDNVPIINANASINGDLISDPLMLYDRTTSTFIAPAISSGVAGQPPRPNTLQIGNPAHDNVPVINSTANLNGSTGSDPLLVYDRTTSTFIAPLVASGVAGQPPLPNTLQLGNPTHTNLPIVNSGADLNGDSVNDPLSVYDQTASTFIAPVIPSQIAGKPPSPNTLAIGNSSHANRPVVNSGANINGSPKGDPLIVYDPNTSLFIAPVIPSTVPGKPPLPNTLALGDPTHDNVPIMASGASTNGTSIVDPLIVYDPLASMFIAPAIASGVPGKAPLPYTLTIGLISPGARQQIPGRRFRFTGV